MEHSRVWWLFLILWIIFRLSFVFGCRSWAVTQSTLRAGHREGGHLQLGGHQRAGHLYHLPAGLSTQPDCTVSHVWWWQHHLFQAEWNTSFIYGWFFKKNKNPSSRPKSCCTTPTVTADQSTSVKYSCSLSAHDPAQLLLELLPTHMAKTFKAHQHSEWTPVGGGDKTYHCSRPACKAVLMFFCLHLAS